MYSVTGRKSMENVSLTDKPPKEAMGKDIKETLFRQLQEHA